MKMLLPCLAQYLQLFDCNFTDQVIRSRGEWSVSLIIFVLIDVDCGDYLILKTPGDQLGQAVSIGGEDSSVTFPLGMNHVLLFKIQNHLDIFRCRQFSKI